MLGTALRTAFGKAGLWWMIRRARPCASDRHDIGRRSEQLAAFFLRSRGYRIVARNYRTGPLEIDLVAVRGWELVFVEVKGTAAAEYDPRTQVNHAKTRALRRAAREFLRAHGLHDPRIQVRFDVVTVRWDARSLARPRITHYPGAF